MSNSSDSLGATVESIEEKADDYATVTNYEATKQEYLNRLSTVESSLGRLEQNVQYMEFLAGILGNVHGEDLPNEVETARESVESVVDRDIADFYELADEKRTDQYDQKVQQTRANVDSAKNVVEAELRDIEDKWTTRVDSARNVERLVGKSRELTQTVNEIENFVERRMWDDSETVRQLGFDWDDLQDQWNDRGVDWETFQEEHALSDSTIDLLKELAKGDELSLDQLTDDIAEEMLSVDELRDVVKLSL